MNTKEIYDYEIKMWESAKNRDPEAFLDVVSSDAVMVCGGYRCTGKEYSEIVSVFDCKSYTIENFTVVNEDTCTVQTSYVISVEVNDEANSDLGGRFFVTTTWSKASGQWKAVFNMDQRIYS